MNWEEEQEFRSLGAHDRREVVDALLRTIDAGDPAQRAAAADRLSHLCIFGLVADVVPIEPLLVLLRSADRRLRELAEYGLAKTNGRALPALVALLDDADPPIRIAAASTLAKMEERAATAAQSLRRRLGDPVTDVRKRAAFALGLIHAADALTIDALTAMADSSDGSERAAALHALGNIAGALFDDALRDRVQATAVKAHEDPDSDARWSALFALSRLECPAKVMLPLVESGLNDPASRVREIAVESLKDLMPQIDLAPLIPRLIQLAKEDEGLIQSGALESLSAAGPLAGAAVPVLRTLAAQPGHPSLPATKALWHITRDASIVLPVLEREFEGDGEPVCDIVCSMGAAAAPLIPKVLSALSDDSYYDLQWVAADALAAIASDDPPVIEALRVALRHPSPIVRGAAARALGNVGAAAVPALIAELEPPFGDHAPYAADALSRMGPTATEAKEALQVAHRDGEWALRAWAAIALARVASDPSVISDLIKLIDAEHDDGPTLDAIQAAQALGASAKKALPALGRARQHWNPDVAAAAEQATKAITQRAH
jgi:HEAT repeat protein